MELLKIAHDAEGVFLERPNRFLGRVNIFFPIKQDGVLIHVHDPGRLPDLLVHGAKVRLKKALNPRRKTGWDLLAVKRHSDWVFVNSAYHRTLVEQLLSNVAISPIGKIKEIEPEFKVGRSRLDFAITLTNGQKVFVETKGCTLAEKGRALFPDAPTARGRKHVSELIGLKQGGARAAIFFLIFRKDAQCFAPNHEIDPEFAKTLKQAQEKGVELYPLLIAYEAPFLIHVGAIPLCDDAFNQLD